MPTSATGNRAGAARQAGFTLVELMVVIVIVGLASGAVMLSLPGDAARLRDAGEALGARLAAARDIAITGGSDVAVSVDAGGYAFLERRGGGWQPAAGRALAPRRLPEGVSALAEVEGGPPLRFDATGLARPTRIVLRRGQRQLLVSVDAAGGVRVDG